MIRPTVQIGTKLLRQVGRKVVASQHAFEDVDRIVLEVHVVELYAHRVFSNRTVLQCGAVGDQVLAGVSSLGSGQRHPAPGRVDQHAAIGMATEAV